MAASRITAVLLLPVAAACGGTPTAATVAPAAGKADPQTAKIGETLSTPRLQATLLAVKPWKGPGYLKSQLAKGDQWWTTHLRVCVPKTASALPFNISFGTGPVMSDDSRPSIEPEWRKPGLVSVNLLPGDCASGWETYQAAKGLRVTGFEMSAPAPEMLDAVFRWRV